MSEMPASESVRPVTSTRDPGDVQVRLERWLGDRLPGGTAPQVSGLEVPATNGMSSETILFEASWDEEGAARTGSFVARLAPDPANVPVFPVYDLDRQFRVMQSVGELTTVPVPRVRWCELDPGALGTPFFVMERVEGQVPPDLMPYNFGDSWLSDASADDQRRLQDSSVGIIARLHAVEHPEREFAFLGTSGLRECVAEQRSYYEWVAAGTPSPLLEACFAWLDEHWPDDEGPLVLSWGDSRIGNIMFRDFEPVAVLDWEMAALGPRELDLAWLTFQHRFFEDLAAEHGFAGMPHFMRREDVAATYERLTGVTPRDLDFYTMYAALRHGIIMSRIARRAIHFGEATMPDDIDDLIMHRSTLEAMLAGTYWDRIV
jgi:aminoglycoside phosphotransferase (APT) family kinase protein